MDKLYINIKKRREALDMSQDELAQAVGYTSRTTIAKIEAGKIDIPRSKIEAFANALNCTPAFLLGWDDAEIITTDLWQFNVVGKIAAGYDHEPIIEYTGETAVIPAIPGYDKDELLIVEIFGRSMWPQFIPGDKVVVRTTSSVNSGEIGCVMVGNEATIKRIVYQKEGETEQFMDLEPINPEYETKHITGEELNSCRVIGKVIKLMRDV